MSRELSTTFKITYDFDLCFNHEKHELHVHKINYSDCGFELSQSLHNKRFDLTISFYFSVFNHFTITMEDRWKCHDDAIWCLEHHCDVVVNNEVSLLCWVINTNYWYIHLR